MDPITHGLSGAVLARTGFRNKYGIATTWIFIVSAMLPDIDWVYSLAGEFAYLKHHRGFTHSLIGGAALAFVNSLIFYHFSSLKRYWLIFRFSLAGIYIHIFLDLITSYGTQIFWPFTDHRYSLDTIFIIDLILTGILLLPLIIGAIRKEREWFYARVSLVLLTCYIAFAGINHLIAIKRVVVYTKENNITGIKLSAFPQPLSPFRWMGVIESQDSFHQFMFNILNTDILKYTSYKKELTNEYIKKAEELDVVKLYKWFAEYPLITTYREENGNFIVEYFDLRFGGFDNRYPFLLTIVMDTNGKIKDTRFFEKIPKRAKT